MSVINKMLRDLDHRANPSVATLPGPAALRQGTASVGMDAFASAPSARSKPRLWLGLGLIAVAAFLGGGWLWWSSLPSTGPFFATRTSANAPAPLAASSTKGASAAPGIAADATASAPIAAAPTPVVSASSTSAVPAEPSVASMILRMESSLSARKALDAMLSKPPPLATNAREASSAPPAPAATASPVTAAVVAPTPSPSPSERANPRGAAPKTLTTATATAPTPTGDSAPILQRQQQAGGDVLTQTQALWNSGSRDAAMDLMQQSIAAAERSAKTGTTGSAVLLPLVREMARMQLAESRFGAVWELLTRLEPLLGNQADLWAIRANAAQRLGRHQDSVHAYMMALQSRPDEQRWLLGTAVSLAALGQTTSAAEMADKARAVGPVSKEILTYLRQTGVQIRE